MRAILLASALAAALHAAPAPAQQVELRFMCYSHANECAVTREVLDRFEQANPDIRVLLDVVSFNVVREQLPVRLNAGAGPDVARVTNIGGLAPHYLDLTPYIDRAYWERHFGPTLDWMRSGRNDRGVYGFVAEFTVSGPIVNVSMFRRAGVELPGADATWDDWARAVGEVQRRLGVYSGIVVDRSGHRFAGPAIAYGARFFDEEGQPRPIDDGFRAWSERMLQWHRAGLMPNDIWPGLSGARWRTGGDMFINQDVVMHLTGSWSIQRFSEEIGSRFEWRAVPPPCGTASCSGMPGGTAVVAFKVTRHPEAVGRLMSHLVSEDALRHYYERTYQLPAHRGLAEAGLNYGPELPRAAADALRVFTDAGRRLAPEAHRLQAYARNHVVFDAIATHIGAALAGRIGLDDAYRRIEAEVEEKVR
jgi:alpha-1,4-digalacturonate transport system substrate-binding protein